jgi:excisionase family DNA binding protein
MCSIGYTRGKKRWVVEPRFLKVADIAADLDLSEDTIRELIRTKQLPAYKVGREYRVLRTEYEEWLQKRRTIEGREDRTQ